MRTDRNRASSLRVLLLAACSAALLGEPRPAGAQLRPAAVELVTGHAGYVDEVWDNRLVLGGVLRLPMTSRLAVGPEVAYLRGDGERYEVTITASATYDLVRPTNRRRVVPFALVSVGWSRRTELVGGGPGSTTLQPFSSTGPTASGGFGARVGLSRHWYVAPDVRLGWEPERRLTVAVGWRPG